uniref:Orotidine 5'-phosphate decarboxylase n=1 Tax=Magnetococcus massalia (strain MO-1) TaxID=451514 RepID=A0A1S7LPQ7_MAGMO|nr:Orotidine 5'-phosphate decarboxylase (OMP decarboxylase) (OMPDCase) (OMPdecase) [Candidatus Magnetococcus massalia]
MAPAPRSIAKTIDPKDRLIFAMDVPDSEACKALVEQLGDQVSFYKLGLEMFLSGDYFELVEWLQARDKKIFADLKLYDIPKTVERAVRQLSDRGVELLTVHAYRPVLEAAAIAKGDHLKVMGVTVLTSMSQENLTEIGIDKSVEQLVLERAQQTLESGCDGVISSGLEAAKIREHVGKELLIVSPGIRPAENRPTDDQKRVVTVADAFNNGVDYIVVGRPIRDAANPAQAAAGIQETIAGIFS